MKNCKKLVFFFLLLSSSAWSHVVEFKYIPPEKRYEMEKQLYESRMGSDPSILLYKEFPDYFLWLQLQEGRERRFEEWVKKFIYFLDGSLSCEISYFIWASQNPTRGW